MKRSTACKNLIGLENETAFRSISNNKRKEDHIDITYHCFKRFKFSQEEVQVSQVEEKMSHLLVNFELPLEDLCADKDESYVFKPSRFFQQVCSYVIIEENIPADTTLFALSPPTSGVQVAPPDLSISLSDEPGYRSIKKISNSTTTSPEIDRNQISLLAAPAEAQVHAQPFPCDNIITYW